MNGHEPIRQAMAALVIIGMAYMPAYAGAPRTIPMTGMEGWSEFNSRVTGLGLAVEDAGWPALRMLSALDDATVMGAVRGSTEKAGGLTPVPLLLGCISG